MTLYTQADSNIRKTWFYLSFFFVLIIAFGWVISYMMNDQAILFWAAIISIAMSFSSYWFSDKIVLSMAGARPIEKADNPELYRLVENLSITAGLPLPKIYIIDEAQPNAFATGRDKDHAVIAVTRGLLEKLEKIELEGVIAHELSHIGNRDMLLQTMVVVLAGVITIASDIFLRSSFSRRSRDNEERGQAGVILMVIGIALIVLAPIFATLLKLAISRKREFLADASGALLTRYPEGLAKALEKIAGDPNQLRTASDATAHLYIANPFRNKNGGNWLHNLFSTHPPLEERVAALRGLQIK